MKESLIEYLKERIHLYERAQEFDVTEFANGSVEVLRDILKWVEYYYPEKSLDAGSQKDVPAEFEKVFEKSFKDILA